MAEEADDTRDGPENPRHDPEEQQNVNPHEKSRPDRTGDPAQRFDDFAMI